jgi:hypothetical protein
MSKMKSPVLSRKIISGISSGKHNISAAMVYHPQKDFDTNKPS